MKYFLLPLLALTILGCDDDEIQPMDGNDGDSLAIPIYNQAYQENYDADNISDILNGARDAYVLVDPFGDGVTEHISSIKANGNEVGAYISIGTGETFRDDYQALQPFLVATPWGEWPDEYFISVTSAEVVSLMKTRIDSIADWGLDWVEFDNMDWIFDDELRATYGFEVTQAQGVAYYQELCDYVHSRGMKCMAKNTVEDAADFDGVLYESYSAEKNWWDQAGAQSFLDAGKLVIVNHYGEQNCGRVYTEYKGIYNANLSFICEDSGLERYVHFNE